MDTFGKRKNNKRTMGIRQEKVLVEVVNGEATWILDGRVIIGKKKN